MSKPKETVGKPRAKKSVKTGKQVANAGSSGAAGSSVSAGARYAAVAGKKRAPAVVALATKPAAAKVAPVTFGRFCDSDESSLYENEHARLGPPPPVPGRDYSELSKEELDDYLYVTRPESVKSMQFGLKFADAQAVYDSRRMGKTMFLQREIAPLIAKTGYHVIYHSFFKPTGATPTNFILQLARESRSESILGRVADWLKKQKVRFKLPDFLAGAEVSFGSEQEEVSQKTDLALLNAFDNILEALAKKYHNILFILDEFQELAKGKPEQIEINAGLIRGLRSFLDNRSAVSTIFAGSDESNLRELFRNYSQPFYGFASGFKLTHFGHDFLDEIVRRLAAVHHPRVTEETTEYVKEIFVPVFDRSPARVRRYWELLGKSSTVALEDVRKVVMKEMPITFDYESEFEMLNAVGREVLIYLAHGVGGKDGLGLFSNTAQQWFEEHMGTGVPQENLQTAVDRLCQLARTAHGIMRDESLIVANASGGFSIVDPNFGAWVAKKNRA